MSEIIVAPNAESALVQWGNAVSVARSLGASVATRQPTGTRPQKWVRLFLAGGRRTSLVTRQQRFVFDFYAPTETSAYAVGAVFLGELLALNTYAGIQFYTPELASDLTNLPDPSVTDRARYSAQIAVGIRAHAV